MTNEELRESLLAAPKNGFLNLTAEQRKEMNEYCAGYAAFMDASKTEREATAWAVAEAEKRGFKPFSPNMRAIPGDKIYLNNRDKSIILAVVGTEPLLSWRSTVLSAARTALRSTSPSVRTQMIPS